MAGVAAWGFRRQMDRPFERDLPDDIVIKVSFEGKIYELNVPSKMTKSEFEEDFQRQFAPAASRIEMNYKDGKRAHFNKMYEANGDLIATIVDTENEQCTFFSCLM